MAIEGVRKVNEYIMANGRTCVINDLSVLPANMQNGTLFIEPHTGEFRLKINGVNSWIKPTPTNLFDANSIPTSLIADNAISSAKIRDGAILSRHIKDLDVTTPKLADNSITTLKIQNDSVTEEKLSAILRNSLLKCTQAGNVFTITYNGRNLFRIEP